MSYIKHINQLPLFIPIVVICSQKETMCQLMDRADRFVQFSPAWSRYPKRIK